ncbi:MAG: hypothetical protein ACI87W_003406, partial [Halieaceae bacterium]
HDVKDEMALFGEVKITRFYILPRFVSTPVVRQPIHASKDRTGVGITLLQIPFLQGIEADFIQVCESEFQNEITLLYPRYFLWSFAKNSLLSKPGADCLSDRLKATLLYITGDEGSEIITKDDARVPEEIYLKASVLDTNTGVWVATAPILRVQ